MEKRNAVWILLTALTISLVIVAQAKQDNELYIQLKL